MRKYTLTEYSIINESETVRQIQALKDFGDVKAGQLGGFIESYDNLSQDGDCWVDLGCVVKGLSTVKANALITQDSVVKGNSIISRNSEIVGSVLTGATVTNSEIQNSELSETSVTNSEIIGSEITKTKVTNSEIQNSEIDHSHIIDTVTVESSVITASYVKSCIHIRNSTVKISHLVNWADIKDSLLEDCRTLGRYIEAADIRDNREILTVSGFLSLWDLSIYPRTDGKIGVSFGAGCFPLEDLHSTVLSDFPDYTEDLEEIQEVTDLLVKILTNRMKTTRASQDGSSGKYSKGLQIIPEGNIKFKL